MLYPCVCMLVDWHFTLPINIILCFADSNYPVSKVNVAMKFQLILNRLVCTTPALLSLIEQVEMGSSICYHLFAQP